MYYSTDLILRILHRIHEAVAEGLQIVHVDGSYLHRKQQSL